MLAAPAGNRPCHRREESPLQRFIERFGALFGAVSILFAFFVVGGLEGGEPPDVSDSTTEQIVAHWMDLGDAAWVGNWLSILCGLLILFWGLWVNSALRDRGATLLAPAAAVGTILIAVGISIDTTAHMVLLDAAENMPAAAAVAISALTQYMFMPYLLGMILIVVSVSASAKKTGLIPPWLAWVGYVTALIMLIPHEIMFIGFMLFVAWMVIAGISMFRKTDAAA